MAQYLLKGKTLSRAIADSLQIKNFFFIRNGFCGCAKPDTCNKNSGIKWCGIESHSTSKTDKAVYYTARRFDEVTGSYSRIAKRRRLIK